MALLYPYFEVWGGMYRAFWFRPLIKKITRIYVFLYDFSPIFTPSIKDKIMLISPGENWFLLDDARQTLV